MKKIHITKKAALVTAAILIMLAASSFGAYRTFRPDATNSASETQASPINPINYDPPTEQEKTDADNHKDELVEQKNQPTAFVGSKVNPIITNASQISQQITINAYVSGIFEDGGTCTATITKGSNKIVKTTKAFANASTTDCTPFRIDRSEFSSSGDWQVIVAYSSPAATGSSQSKTLALQ